MASAVRRLTQDEMYDYLDENFDIPDDGVNSDIEGLDEDSLDEQDDEFATQAANIDIVFVDEDDIDVNLAAVDIIENSGRGRPSNVSVADFQWSCERGNVDIPSFSQVVGPTQVMPDNRKRGRPSDELLLARHVERHFPDFLPTNENGKRKERRCKVCYSHGVNKKTSYYCADCDVGLCVASCFRLFHQP